MEAIKNALAWARQNGRNQSDLARAIGVLPQDITNWKKRGMPAEWWPAVADLFGRSVDDLLGRGTSESRTNDESGHVAWPFHSVSLDRILALPADVRDEVEDDLLHSIERIERRLSKKRSHQTTRSAA